MQNWLPTKNRHMFEQQTKDLLELLDLSHLSDADLLRLNANLKELNLKLFKAPKNDNWVRDIGLE